MKVEVNGDRVPVSISKEPKPLVKGKEIPKSRLFRKFMLLNYEILMKHWNQEIDDEFFKKKFEESLIIKDTLMDLFH